MNQTPGGFLQHAERVLRQIDAYEMAGATEIPSMDLKTARKKIHSMINCVKEDRLPKKSVRYPELSHMIVDQWPLGHSLGNAISILEREYLLL